MQPLKTNKMLLIWLGMCKADKFTSKKFKIAHFGVTSVIFTLNLIGLISNTIYILFVAADLEGGLFTFMTINAYVSILYTLVNAFMSRCKINGIFDKLSSIWSESE